jgi:hypothetical protein
MFIAAYIGPCTSTAKDQLPTILNNNNNNNNCCWGEGEHPIAFRERCRFPDPYQQDCGGIGIITAVRDGK